MSGHGVNILGEQAHEVPAEGQGRGGMDAPLEALERDRSMRELILNLLFFCEHQTRLGLRSRRGWKVCDVRDARMTRYYFLDEQTESVVHHAQDDDDVREATVFLNVQYRFLTSKYVLSTAVDIFYSLQLQLQ